jgi:hypothetical protein
LIAAASTRSRTTERSCAAPVRGRCWRAWRPGIAPFEGDRRAQLPRVGQSCGRRRIPGRTGVGIGIANRDREPGSRTGIENRDREPGSRTGIENRDREPGSGRAGSRRAERGEAGGRSGAPGVGAVVCDWKAERGPGWRPAGVPGAWRGTTPPKALRPADYRTGIQWLRAGICWPIVRCGNVGTVDALAV